MLLRLVPWLITVRPTVLQMLGGVVVLGAIAMVIRTPSEVTGSGVSTGSGLESIAVTPAVEPPARAP